MGKRYSTEIKSEVLGKVRGGQKVSEVSRQHGISEMTVRTWLERDTTEGASAVLEMSRLKRGNEALLRIVGKLTYESEMQKKNRSRVCR